MEIKNMRMVMSQVLSVALLVSVAVSVQAATLVQVFSCTVNVGYTEDD